MITVHWKNWKGGYNYLGFEVNKLAFKLDEKNNFKEVLLIIKLWDAEKFYKKVLERYGEPNTSSLSKY